MTIAKKICALALVTVATMGATKPASTAVLTVQKGYDQGVGLGSGTAQMYDISNISECKGRKRVAGFSWVTSLEKSKIITAGSIVYLSARTVRYTSGGAVVTPSGVVGNLNTGRCENDVSFVPQAGEHYIAVQKVTVGRACSMSVLTQGANTPPADLVQLEPPQC